MEKDLQGSVLSHSLVKGREGVWDHLKSREVEIYGN
jgi:hypothetical protein